MGLIIPPRRLHHARQFDVSKPLRNRLGALELTNDLFRAALGGLGRMNEKTAGGRNTGPNATQCGRRQTGIVVIEKGILAYEKTKKNAARS